MAKLKVGDLVVAIAGVVLLVCSFLDQLGVSYNAYNTPVLNELIGTYLAGLVIAVLAVLASLEVLPASAVVRRAVTGASVLLLVDAIFSAVALDAVISSLSANAGTADPGLGVGPYLGIAAAAVLAATLVLGDVLPFLGAPILGRSSEPAPLARTTGGPYPEAGGGWQPDVSGFGAPAPQPPSSYPPPDPQVDPAGFPPPSGQPAPTGEAAPPVPSPFAPSGQEPTPPQPAAARQSDTPQPGGTPEADAARQPEPHESWAPAPAPGPANPYPAPGAPTANPYAAPVPVAAPFTPFWAAVPTPRPIYRTDDPSAVLATLQPGTWYAAVAPHSHGLMVQIPSGETGVLVEVADIFRG